MKPGLKLYKSHPVGRDPRRMTPGELKEMGHEPMSPLQAIRARCLDCCGYQEGEVALCPAVECPSWPFRTRTNPWRKPASEGRREAARRAMTNLNARRWKRDGVEPFASPPEHGIAPLLAEGSGVALTWTTARVDRYPETERYRENRGAGGEDGGQFPGERISDDGQAAAAGETPEGRSG